MVHIELKSAVSSTSHTLCYLLNIKGFKILLDCTTDKHFFCCFPPQDDSYEHEIIKLYPPKLSTLDLSTINLILISTIDSVLTLPYILSNPSFTGKVISTSPTLRLGVLAALNLYYQIQNSLACGFRIPIKANCSRSNVDGAKDFNATDEKHNRTPCYQNYQTLKDIQLYASKVETVSYHEQKTFTLPGTTTRNESLLNINAIPSGSHIGGCLWKMNLGSMGKSIVYISALSFSENRFPVPFNFCDIITSTNTEKKNSAVDIRNELRVNKKKHDIDNNSYEIEFDSLCIIGQEFHHNPQLVISPDTYSEDMIGKISLRVFSTIRKGGKVLIPANPSNAPVLDLVRALGSLLRRKGNNLSHVPIILVSPLAQKILDFYNAFDECSSWINSVYSQQQAASNRGSDLFLMQELHASGQLHIFPTITDNPKLLESLLQSQCIVLCGHASCRMGDITHFIRGWGQDENNTMILMDSNYTDPNIVLKPFLPLKMKIESLPINHLSTFKEWNNFLDSLSASSSTSSHNTTNRTRVCVPSWAMKAASEAPPAPDLQRALSLGILPASTTSSNTYEIFPYPDDCTEAVMISNSSNDADDNDSNCENNAIMDGFRDIVFLDEEVMQSIKLEKLSDSIAIGKVTASIHTHKGIIKLKKI